MKFLANRDVAGFEDVDEADDERGTAEPTNGACGGERPLACGGGRPLAENECCCRGAGRMAREPGEDEGID
jgi:hypothetical protein